MLQSSYLVVSTCEHLIEAWAFFFFFLNSSDYVAYEFIFLEEKPFWRY